MEAVVSCECECKHNMGATDLAYTIERTASMQSFPAMCSCMRDCYPATGSVSASCSKHQYSVQSTEKVV